MIDARRVFYQAATSDMDNAIDPTNLWRNGCGLLVNPCGRHDSIAQCGGGAIKRGSRIQSHP